MLKIENLDVAIGRVAILRHVSLDLSTGQMAGLIGRNGAGKTTLLRSIMGLLPPNQGSIVLDETDLTQAPAHLRTRLGVGYMPEDRRLVPQLSVYENICVPAWAMHRRDTEEGWQRVCRMIPEVAEFASRKAQQLSGGQQKLVAIGRALMCGSRLLLLDEPFEGVAPALSRRIAEVVAGLKSAGLSIILAESDLQHCAELLDCVFRIERGEVTQAEAAPPAEPAMP